MPTPPLRTVPPASAMPTGGGLQRGYNEILSSPAQLLHISNRSVVAKSSLVNGIPAREKAFGVRVGRCASLASWASSCASV
jgi:hypothetical protein